MRSARVPLIVNVIRSLGTGGMENGLVNIINRTDPHRYHHVVICLTAAHEFARRISVPGVKVLELHKKEGQDWSVYPKLLRLLRELQPDIIHTRNLAALDVQVLGTFLPGVKRVHGEHGRDIYDLDGSNWKYRLLRKIMRLFVDRYIAVSKDLEGWLLESIGVKEELVNQIYNGVELTKFFPGAEDRPSLLPQKMLQGEAPLVIGTVGRLVEVKDQRLILQAVSILLSKDDTWRHRLCVVIVGAGPLEESLQELAMELGIQDLVWMPGDREDIPELLRVMDVFVLSSLGEGISNTILEAMASGLSVVATAVGGNCELINDGVNGRLIPVGDAEALSDTLKQLLKSEEIRSSLGKRALEDVRSKFDWDRTVESYLKIYDELLGVLEVENAIGSGSYIGNVKGRNR